MYIRAILCVFTLIISIIRLFNMPCNELFSCPVCSDWSDTWPHQFYGCPFCAPTTSTRQTVNMAINSNFHTIGAITDWQFSVNFFNLHICRPHFLVVWCTLLMEDTIETFHSVTSCNGYIKVIDDLKLSRRLNSLKLYQVRSLARWLTGEWINLSRTISVLERLVCLPFNYMTLTTPL